MRIVAGCLAQKDRDCVRKARGSSSCSARTTCIRVLTLLDHAEWGPVTDIWEETGSIDDVPRRCRPPRGSAFGVGDDHDRLRQRLQFCIVPLVRGKEISRRPGDVVREVRDLAADGVVADHPPRPERELVRA